MADGDDRRIELSTEKARQGRPGWPVLRVLVAGLALALVVWGLVGIYGAYISPPASEQVGNPATVNRPGAVEGNVPADSN